jgi:hypothetical protein
MQLSCPRLSLVMGAGFMLMILSQRNNLPNGKEKNKVKRMLIIFFDIKGIVLKKIVLAGQGINSAYNCDVSWQLLENVYSLRPKLW